MRIFPVLTLLCLGAAVVAQPIKLDVDASNVPGLIIHVHENIPVSPGPISLYYPQWIPGEHGPDGPLGNLLEMHFRGNGQEISWDRDDVDAYEFHLNIPAGVSELVADFDDANDPNSQVNPFLARVSWHRDVLYPAGQPSDDIMFQATLKLPKGWNFGTALPIDHTDGDTTYFKPIAFTRLIDDPVIAGQYFNKIVLMDSPLHEMDIAGDTADDVTVPTAIEDKMKRLVAEEYAYFGARHYNDYHFLLSCSSFGAYMGLEHNESSEDGLAPNGVKDSNALGYLLCHEYTHSWCGKYRRPAGLATPNYDAPMKGELLWVYEGFTEFTGTMLTARTGFWTDEEFREALAGIAATMDTQQGRTWRPLVDTARSAHDFGGGGAWGAERRSAGDYYREMVLIWLDVDATIRRLTNDKKSIDDFAKVFFGAPSTGPIISPYTFNDIVTALNTVVPNDWAAFLKDRIYTVKDHAPVGGIEGDGWKVVYSNEPNSRSEQRYGGGPLGVRFSLGLTVGGDGSISETILGMPGREAGLCPGMKITQVNGQAFTDHALAGAVKAETPITITVNYDGLAQTFTINYTGGLRQPHLVRDDSKPDYLSELIKPHAH